MKDGNLQYLEDCFTDLQLNVTAREKKLEDMARVLNRKFNRGMNCESIIISPNDGEPFVMSVYPIRNQLNVLANDLIYGETADKGKWEPSAKRVIENIRYIIEIDERVLTDMVAKFTAKELTAVMLHEVGHIMDYKAKHSEMKLLYSDAISTERINNDEFDIITEASNDKVKKSANMITRLYIIDYLKHAQFFNTDESIQMEKRADKFVIDWGYGQELHSAIHKIQKHYRIRLASSMSAIANAQAYVKMLMATRTRKRYIMENLKTEARKERRTYVKSMIDEFHRFLFKNGFGMEDRIKLYSTGIQEGFLREIISPIKVTKKDIDILGVEMEMIETVDDKMSVVYKIHKRISQLDDSAIAYKDDRHKMTEINSNRNRLLEMLKKTKDVKIKEKSYGIFVQYPDGYQG